MKNTVYTCSEMPDIEEQGKVTSIFEFWPNSIMYFPVAIQWLGLAIKYRSMTLPLNVNPKLTLSGMVGAQKSELFSQAKGACYKAILPWILHQTDDRVAVIQAQEWLEQIMQKEINYPFVCKPDIGCRGSGIKLIKSFQQLQDYVSAYPAGTPLLAQKLSSWDPEAGIFYVREPDQSQGKIVSLALKHSPYVIGDGLSTLEQLIDQDRRAKLLKSVYYQRLKQDWDKVIEKNESVRLVFSASHCRGAIFKDAREHITPELTEKINKIMQGLPEFHYGRLDVKFSSLDNLKQGGDIEIVEINGASSESIHIWDSRTSLKEAISTLLWQYRKLFVIGEKNRQRGFIPSSIAKFYKHWQKERALAKHYPLTD